MSGWKKKQRCHIPQKRINSAVTAISSSGFESSITIEAKTQIESVEANDSIMFQPHSVPVPESFTEPTKFYEPKNPGSYDTEQTLLQLKIAKTVMEAQLMAAGNVSESDFDIDDESK